MAAFERPADDRNDAALAAYEMSSRGSEEGATCPLLTGEVQLLPLRYGLVEELEPGVATPYTLTARPLGIRLLRNGYLYVLDGESLQLDEYEFRDFGNTITGGKLEYETDRTLYVCFSEVQWTATKRSQVTESEEDRDAFMQAVDLAGADPVSGGGQHLITTAQAEEWVAEFAEDAQLEVPEEGYEQEAEPYLWENEPYYHKSRLGKLLKQHGVEDRCEALCLIVRDDIGVMRDLAQFQDEVVGWVEDWATGGEGNTERDYLLACYIESLSQLKDNSLDDLRQVSEDPDVQAMWDDVAAMEEPRQGEVRQSLLDFLNRDSNTGELPHSYDPDLPEDLKGRLQEMRSEADRANARDIAYRLQEEVRRYYVEDSLSDSLGRDFVDQHSDALLSMKRQHNERLKALLEGSQIGERGINELIDRERMDAFLAEQRPRLQRWNTTLDALSDDRADMLCSNRFHTAAWYFDAQDEQQVKEGFSAQYGCLKDICRSDEATERVANWLEEAPYYDRPLFHTLSLADQSDFIGQYSTITNAGYGTVLKAKDLWDKLNSVESGRLPAVDQLSEETQVIAEGAHQPFAPAISRGIAQVMDEFYQSIDRDTVPDLDELFRRLPKALPARILDSANRTGATFIVASREELDNFRRTMQRVLALREELDEIRKRRNIVKANAGHSSPEAKALLEKFKRIRQELQTVHEPKLAQALSPIEELPEDSVRVAGAAPGRAGLTLVLPAAQQAEVGGLIRNIRQGVAAAPKASLVGDGVGLLVFAAQLSTLVETFSQYRARRGTDQALTLLDLGKVIAATSSAGLLAAQGIMDTALVARSKALVNALDASGAQSVASSLGKLHAFLGFWTYVFGSVASYSSFQNRRSDWQEAIRNGNPQAQSAAMASVVGAGGMLGANAYGLANTLRAGASVAFRGVEWAAAGARLGSVFWRFNLAGALFTALELGGSWLYNRYSTSRHDDWLLSTPWTQDAEQARDDSLETYQSRLQEISQAPKLNVSIEEYDSWWKNRLEGPKSVDFDLSFSSIGLKDMTAPFGGTPPCILSLACYQVRSNTGPGPREFWSPVNDRVDGKLQQEDGQPLTFAFSRPEPEGSLDWRSYDIVVAIRLESLSNDGQYRPTDYHIRVSLAGGEGVYTPSEVTIRGEPTTWQRIDPLLFT
ncbi:toxin VasX [Halomonas stenophila]|uniref:Molecular chaperone GrpE (Heat shock protein) n=1 Tax=Halomonas stenophila TaxID=795312 RepID=A0A7W5HMK7_9GAMM|nr:toxin VasX [Halomonas stenophila]MBB3232498.1 molecular chaperone GrpE (heat shock protein) [Halomonas stenophila]